jgi:uncharacterized membrane protein
MGHEARGREAGGREASRAQKPSETGSGLWLAAGAAAVAGGLAAWAMKPRAPSGEMSDAPPHSWRDRPKLVGAAVIIDAPAGQLYQRWRCFRDFDLFMPNVVDVQPVGAHGEADWTVRGPANADFHFRSRIVEDIPGSRIAWAAEGSPARHEGSVTFEETARGTLVKLEMAFDPPGGAVGMAAAKLVGMVNANDPKRVARQALKRLKQLMETGEIARSTGAMA